MTKSAKKQIMYTTYHLFHRNITYLHAATGFPVKETWLDTIKVGNFITWPNLSTLAVQKHSPDSDKTKKGHIKKPCQGVRSTKLKENTRSEDENIPGNTARYILHYSMV
jgi:hypothetical protein